MRYRYPTLVSMPSRAWCIGWSVPPRMSRTCRKLVPEQVFGDAGYTGVDKRDEMQGKLVKWQVTAKRGKIKAMQEGPLKELLVELERTKAQIRARVEHPFHVIKNLFRHCKVRYKGLVKNTAQLFSLFGLANLVIARNRLRPAHAHGGNPS